MAPHADPAARNRILSRTPLLRIGETSEVAATVAFLASGEASYITGEVLHADGGRLALNYVVDVPDEEMFAPFLQVTRVSSFDQAVQAANATRYGLSAGLISDDPANWDRFIRRIRGGVVNFNRPTTGAAGDMPFGGLGASGNHRPSAYYAADYCAYPVASFEADAVKSIEGEIRGLR